MSRYRDALRRRDLRLLIAALVVDQIGNWSCFVVISVYVFDRTHSTQWLAVLGLCRFGPGLLLASYGGVIADRYQRVTVLIVSALANAVIMTGMAVVVGVGASIGPVLALTALSSVATIPYRPAAGALTPDVAGEKDLAAANSIFATVENLMVVVGPGIGGLLLLTGRPVIGVAVNAASFAVAAGIISRLRVRSRGGAGAGESAVRSLLTGVKALAAQPVAVAVILFCALDSAVYGAASVLYVPLSVRLGTGANGYSYLLAGTALGAVLGAGLANRLSGAARLAPVIMGSLCLQALPYLATVPVHRPALAAILQVVSGFGMVIVDVLAITTLQRDLPGEVLSRVLGICDTLILGAILLASLAAGILLAHADVNVALVAVGVGIPAIGLVGLPTLLRADRTSAAEALWILASGELSVQVSGDGTGPRDLPPVTAPGYVGELGLLHRIPRTATVRTAQPSTLLRIDGEDFRSALQASLPSPSLLAVAGARMARTPEGPPRPQTSPASSQAGAS